MKSPPADLSRLLPLFSLAVAIFLVFSYTSSGNWLHTQTVLTVSAVVLLGMPHGALDILMLERLTISMSQKLAIPRGYLIIAFSFAYTLVAIAAFFLWLALPFFALAAFLLIAIAHFANDWSGFGARPMQLAFGGLVVNLPAVQFSQQLQQLFQLLSVPAQQAIWVVSAMQALLFIGALVITWSWLIRTPSTKHLLSVSLVTLAGLLLPPLLFFVAYFCALHSVLHTLSVKQDCKVGWHTLGKRIALPFAGTLVLLLLAALVVPAAGVTAKGLQVLFIGLFALTVPHVLLSAVFGHHSHADIDAGPL